MCGLACHLSWGSPVGVAICPAGWAESPRNSVSPPSRGQSLPQALAEHDQSIPPVYRAIVTAGLKSGRLPAALESLASTARKLKEVRGAVGLAVLYPLLLVMLAYWLFVFLAAFLMPALMLVFEAPPPWLWTAVARVGTWAGTTLPVAGMSIPVVIIPPLLLIGIAVAWWIETRRAIVIRARSFAQWVVCVPLAGRIARHARAACLAEILGLLVEQDVPLDEAILLAAECTGDRRLMKSAGKWAESLRQGNAPVAGWKYLDEFPPLLAWLVTAGGRQQTFAAMARHVADTYRRRIVRDAAWLRDYLPMWLTVVVGGSLVALFGVTLFLPFSQLLEGLSKAVGSTMRIKP